MSGILVDRDEVFIDLSTTNRRPMNIDVFCSNASRPEWYYKDRWMPTITCQGGVEEHDYVCLTSKSGLKLHIAKPSQKHAGVYECRERENPTKVATVYVQSTRPCYVALRTN